MANSLPHIPPTSGLSLNENCNSWIEWHEHGHGQGLHNIDGTWPRFWGLNKLPTVGNSSCYYSSYSCSTVVAAAITDFCQLTSAFLALLEFVPSAVCGAGSYAVSTRTITDSPSVCAYLLSSVSDTVRLSGLIYICEYACAVRCLCMILRPFVCCCPQILYYPMFV